MKPTDHFVGRVYEWPVSKEQFNHLLEQIDKLNARIEELENQLTDEQGRHCWDCGCDD